MEDQVPALHRVQELDARPDHVPALQEEHCEIKDAPDVGEKVPALQLKH